MSVTNDSRERPEWANRIFASDLDPEIAAYVHLLMDHDVETYESCQGGSGHGGGAGEWPVIRFYGGHHEGHRALSVAMMYKLPVCALNRTWHVIDGEPTGPQWEMVFYPSALAAREAGADEGRGDG